jgi:hypothetical protein
MKSYSLTLACALLYVSTSIVHAAEDNWRFDVLLDGKSIGYHHFQLRSDGTQRELLSEARFNVKILFVNVYHYAHDAHEFWNDDCLKRIDSSTDDNGKKRSVRGTRDDVRFTVATSDRTDELTSCVMTFAYWNPRILEATHLLNPQTGEYVPVHITHVGTEMITARGVSQPAEHFRLVGDALIGGKLKIDLWYSSNKDWLALESLSENGRVIRYQIL